MSLFFIKTGDRLPSIEAGLVDATGDPIDLTDVSSVRFICSNGVDAAAVVVSPATNGVVRYDWQDGDTAQAGQFDGEFELTWTDGRKQTIPNGQDEYIKVIITAGLG